MCLILQSLSEVSQLMKYEEVLSRMIHLLLWSDLRYNKFVGSNQCRGWKKTTSATFSFCNWQLGLFLSAAKDEKYQPGEPKKGFVLGGRAVRAMEGHGCHSYFALSFKGCTCLLYSSCYIRRTNYMYIYVYIIYIYRWMWGSIFTRVYTCTHSAIHIQW